MLEQKESIDLAQLKVRIDVENLDETTEKLKMLKSLIIEINDLSNGKLFKVEGRVNVIYGRIKKLCVKKGISLASLETELSFGNGTISKWRESSPSVDNLKKVAYFFGVSLDYLVGIKEDK